MAPGKQNSFSVFLIGVTECYGTLMMQLIIYKIVLKIWGSSCFIMNGIVRPANLKEIEAVVRRCSEEKVFLEILQISQETPVLESLF